MHAHAITAALLLALLASSEPLNAQGRSDGEFIARADSARPPSQPGQTRPVAPQEQEEVDESALRYYASLRQTDRVDAETRRLKRLYPAWKPPGDLYNSIAPGGGDEEDLWALFALDRIDELHAAIEQRKLTQPGWKPSRDLASKLARKELRLKVLALVNQNENEALFDFMKSVSLKPDDLDLDVLWKLAETYAKAKQVQEAVAIYQSILSSNNKPAERIATIQKALGSLPMSQVELLLAATPGDGRTEFGSIWIDITRARISAYLQGERAEEVLPADVALFQEHAAKSNDPNQTGVLAWYEFKRNRFPESLELFKIALEKGGDAMIAHGLAHSLIRVGKRREAEEVAYAWREPLTQNAILFIDTLAEDLTREVPVYVETERLARYGRVVMLNESGEGAQALAWYAYNSCQFDTALPWFERAVAWFPKPATVMGYALTSQRLKRRKEFVEEVNRYDGLFPEVVGLIIPDDTQKPPHACDTNANARTTREPLPAPREAWGRVAPPSSTAVSRQEQEAVLRKLNRKEFPIAVTPENDLRFTASGTFQPSTGGGWLRESYTGPYPLVARRVPGVGPMPYERFGFALLPGWNGIETATWPPSAAQLPPEGTLWAAQIVASASGPQQDAPPSPRQARPR